MLKYKVKISKKGQIAIPKKIRDKLATDILEMEMLEDKLVLTPSKSILAIGGRLKPYAKNIIKKRRATDEDQQGWETHVKEKFGGS
ncbi:MAG: AbrB/MazE/SpoVT family DNA-binding domain-containing protein [Calditrichaeota bacterium]|nr:MAG: AbrB/MazE/SpoVT family DNA-binding domain-containing protein [Calditrichota bacterium]